MSYCVNCGVKLQENTEKCPLCDCPVINPYTEYKKLSGKMPASPPPVDLAPVTDWRDLTHFIASITLVIGVLSCGIVDLAVSGSLTWSLIPIFSCVTAYTWFCLPLKAKKIKVWLYVLFDFLAAVLNMTVIARFINKFEWLLYIALPLAAASAVCIGLAATLFHRHRIRYFHICAICSFLTGLLAVLTELLVSRGSSITWSGIAAISCITTSAVLCIIAKSRRLSRRFHI